MSIYLNPQVYIEFTLATIAEGCKIWELAKSLENKLNTHTTINFSDNSKRQKGANIYEKKQNKIKDIIKLIKLQKGSEWDRARRKGNKWRKKVV